MTRRGQVLRVGARVLSGVVVLGVAGLALTAVRTLDLPEVAREPLSITVDTTHDAARTIVCPGSFSELGADPEHPDTTVPTGSPDRAIAGEAAENRELARAASDDGQPLALTAPLADPLGAAQLQHVRTTALRGAAATVCVEPLNEQWLLGGESTVGVSTTLDLTNPGDVAASVTLTVYDEQGEVDAAKTAGVIVAPGSAQTVALNGFAPESKSLAVRVVSTGAPVAASLGVGHVAGLEPFAVSSVTRQTAPETMLVIPGVTNTSAADGGHSDAGDGDEYPVVVRALAPGGENATVRVRAIDQKGRSTDLGTIELVPDAVGQLSIATWPRGADAVAIEADVPVVASARGFASDGGEHDYEWFVPAPDLAADEPVAIPTVKGSQLILVNTSDDDAEVRVEPAKGKKDLRTTVAAGAVRVVTAPANGVLTSSAPIHAGIRVIDGGDISGYPIVAADPRDGERTVFTR